MKRGVIDGERWIRERLRFLRDLLDDDTIEPARRRAVEDEIDVLSKERGLLLGGHRFPFPRRRRPTR